ncbi:MAG: SecD/SecF family protein translocase subunit [Oscillospiraceae bacterium]|nr:SecD/SecF family protein translocase subunit [Oscillospiraceae bacterium]
MKSRITKPVFFIMLILIVAFTLLSTMGIKSYYGDIKQNYIWGIDDIRWGIDIRGGVNVTFGVPKDYSDNNPVTEDALNSAKSIIEMRLINKNINDYEVYVDAATNGIIVQFPWQSGDNTFDPQKAVEEIGETALLTFREKHEVDSDGLPTGETTSVILTGSDVESATAGYDSKDDEYIVQLKFKESGKQKFAAATEKLKGDIISIWMDDVCISYPKVNSVITNGEAIISGSFTADEATDLANKINGGALPFKLEVESLSTISPILGIGARDAMALAGLIAFVLIAIFMIIYYRLPGVVAVIALTGQVAGMFAAITGFFGFNDASSLTLPGIAGIILSIGMGVDANVISAERIKEEIKAGRTIDGALRNGFSRGFTAILDSNLTVIIVAVILMAVFGTWFGASTEGTIYSFGYTLLAGVIMNFIMACWATRLMTISLSKFKCFRKPGFYGVSKKELPTDTDIEKGKDTVHNIEVKTRLDADFVSKRKVYVIISSVAIALTVIFTFVLGVNVDIRFKGGTIITYSYEGTVDTNAIKSAVESLGTPRATVTTGTSFTDSLNTIVVSFAADEKMDDVMLQKVSEKLIEEYPDNNIINLDTTNVSASAGSQFFISCLIAVVVAFVLLVVYIAFRFRKIGGWSAGIIAIICLVHDVLMTYAVYVFAGMSLDSNFMAVILTLLGYSINNTIIVYDRLRENRAKHGGRLSDRELVNLSVNQMLSRSIITTATTVTAMLSISIVCAVMGVTSILTFAIPLAFGMLVGFYSSLCLAGPLWIWWQERKPGKKSSAAKAAKADN